MAKNRQGSGAGSDLAAHRKVRMKNCDHCNRRFRAFGKAKFCSDKCRFDAHNLKRTERQNKILNPIAEQFKRINYSALNSSQQEVYNFQKVTAVLADYGFDCIRLGDDWNGADFLAHSMISGTTLKIQLKSRISLDKKYIGENLWICCPINDRWLLIPHDTLHSLILETIPTFEKAISWTRDGIRRIKTPSNKLRPKLEPWLI